MNRTPVDSAGTDRDRNPNAKAHARLSANSGRSAVDHAMQRLREKEPLATVSSSSTASQYLAALNTLGSSVTTESNTELLFENLLMVFPQLLPADHLLVCLEEDESLALVACNLNRSECTQLGQQLSPLIHESIASHQPARLSSGDILERTQLDEMSALGYLPQSLLVAPLLKQQECVGVIIACAEAEDVFTGVSLQALVSAAHWIVSAIRHEEQQQSLQSRLEELGTLATINRLISETVELEDVLQLIVESAEEIVCECDWAVLHLIDEERQQLVPVVTCGLTLQDNEYRLALEDGVIGNVFQSGTYINVHDLQEDERRQPFDIAIQSRSMLVAPLKNKEECIGTLSVQCATPGTYSEADERLLTLLGLQAFVAIKNAELFDAQREAYHQAEMLRNITADLGRSLEPDAVFLTLRRSLDKVFDYQYALIMLLQNRENQASLHICCDVSPAESALHCPEELPDEVDLDSVPELQRLFEQRSVLIIDDIEQEEQWGQQFWFVPGLRSWLAAPMVAQDQVIGIFWVAKKAIGGLSEDSEQVLAESLASAAASALQNTSLHVEMQHASARLRRLNHMVLTAQEEERQRISRELHDESGQALSALMISLNMANQELQRGLLAADGDAAPEAALLGNVQQRLSGAIDTIEVTMDRIRKLTHNLRPPMLSTLGLNATLEGLCQDFTAQTDIKVRYSGTQLPSLPGIISISLYRILQEALANVAKHAHATSVTISLVCDHEQIELTIRDDGCGFSTSPSLDAPSSGIGLLGMIERCEMLNGTLQVDTQQDAGTTVTATIPFEMAPANAPAFQGDMATE